MKIVINKSIFGFSISRKAVEFMAARGNKCAIQELEKARLDEPRFYDITGCRREDPDLVAAVEELGKDANGNHADLKVVKIPDGVRWKIAAFDGIEWVAEEHRTWG